MSLHTIIDEFRLLWWGILSHRTRLSFLCSCKTDTLKSCRFPTSPSLISQDKKITQSAFLPPLVFWVTFFCSTASPSSVSVSEVSVAFDWHPVTSMTESTCGPKNKVYELHSSKSQLDISTRDNKQLRPLLISKKIRICTLPVIKLAPSSTALMEETLRTFRRFVDLKTETFVKLKLCVCKLRTLNVKNNNGCVECKYEKQSYVINSKHETNANGILGSCEHVWCVLHQANPEHLPLKKQTYL